MERPFSGRARAVALRSYQRPLGGGRFESFPDMIHRAHYDHQKQLARSNGFNVPEDELCYLEQLGNERKAFLAGRTLWLGGTDYAFDRAACQFNCAFTEASTVFDIVDIAWLLLNGSGVGAKPRQGTLHGFMSRLEIKVIPSTRRAEWKGPDHNDEVFQPMEDGDGYEWTIRVGDSAMAWAKAIGKLLASPRRAVRRLVLDFSNVRGKGGRLKGYGWVCNGWEPLRDAMVAIAEICNRAAGQLLTEIQIGDIINQIGTVLSSRRSAQALLMDGWNPRVGEFKDLKREYYKDAPWRDQSNNSVVYWSRPSVAELEELLHYADECGGDPGIVNGHAAVLRCPWFVGFNPCFEIMLASKGFCNLVTLCVPAFGRDFAALAEAVYFMARANYRQTCVDLRDPILQPAWHQTNEALRLCGVSLTGLEQATWLSDYQIRHLRNQAVAGAYSQAEDWKLPYPKAVTTIKPEGTSSKVFDCTEGVHKPGGKFIFNWVNYPSESEIVGIFKRSGYKTMKNGRNTLICHPVEYNGVAFDRAPDGRLYNGETAIAQLEKYRRWNTLWADHNVSCTVSYEPEEIPAIARWVHDNWDKGYVATAFLRRINPLMRPEDVGHAYLPQQVVTEAEFRTYEATLSEVNLDTFNGEQIGVSEDGNCKEGSCAIN